MFCKSCGKQNQDGMQYCEFCGTKIGNQLKQTKPVINYTDTSQKSGEIKRDEHTHKGRNKTVALFVGMGVIVLILICILNPFSDPVGKFSKLLDENDYQAAAEVYEEKIQGNSEMESEAADIVIAKVQQLLGDFDNNTIGYDELIEACDYFIKMGTVDDGDELLYGISDKQASKEAYMTGNSYFEEGNYSEALNQLSQVSQDDQNYSDAVDKMQQCTTAIENQMLEEAAQMTQNGEYLDAISYLEQNKASFQDLSQIDLLISNYEEEFMQYEIAKAQALYDEGKVTEAIESLEASYDKSPCELFNTMLDQYKPYEPRPLNEFDEMDHDYYANLYYDRDGKDSFKNEYHGYAQLHTWANKNHETSMVVGLQGRFSKFKGTYVCTEDMELDDSINLKIYADNNLVLESGYINALTNPTDFELDITGAQTLKFVAESLSERENFTGMPGVMIVNSLIYN